jgi:tetratricopeptide (TPR) repeat protein
VIVTGQGIAKLTDFGLSRSITARISQEGIIVGTVYYLAPEQALRQDIDARADLYAFGVLLYEMATGRLPFTADDPLGVISQHLNAPVVPPSTYSEFIPPALEALILRLMNKDPDDRPESAAVVLEALERIYEEPQEYDSTILAGLSPLDRLTRGKLVGRQAEFAQIKSMWRELLREATGQNGAENVLVISGEPGIGKTPLIKEVRSLAQVSGAQTLLGECFAREAAPYAPIVQIIRESLPLPEGLPDIVIADLHALAPDLDLRPVPVTPSLSPLSEQQRLFESLFALFATRAERQPLLMILEDAQWADGNTLMLIRHLARRSRATHLRMMIILSFRPGEVEDRSAFRNLLLELGQDRLSVSIELKPFDREQTREVLQTMFMQEITEEFLDAIYEVTEGNLFFIEQVCKALIEEEKLYYKEGHWNFCGAEELGLPKSVRVALQVRINRLPESAQDVLRMASIIGREFDYEILLRACEKQDEDELIDALETAERAQLIGEIKPGGRAKVPQGGAAVSERFAFAHALIPTTLRDELSSLRRRRIHRRVGEAIETVSPEDFEELAYHFGQAGDQEKARFYTMRAGDRARKLYANDEALRFYNQALLLTPENHPDRFHILAARAQVYGVLAQREPQREDIEELLRLAENSNDDAMLCDALIGLADLFLVTANHLSYEPSQRAVEIARKLADPVREGRALRCLGWNAYVRHDFHESLSSLETAVARFRQAGMLPQAAECLHMLSLVTGPQGLGEMAISQKYAEDAVQVSRLAGDPRQEAISLRRVAIVKMGARHYDEALQISQQALTLHRELGDRYEECNALNAIAVMLSSMNQHEEALEHFKQAYDMALALGSSMSIWIIFENIEWRHYRRLGLFEEGIAFADALLNRADLQKDAFLITNILMLKAEILAEVGQYPAAAQVLGKALEMADRHAGAVLRAGIRMRIARLQADMGHFNEAQNTLEGARLVAEKFERPIDVATLLMYDAEIARIEWEGGQLRQIRSAAAQIEKAISLLHATPWDYDLALALTTAVWIALAQNDPERAASYASEAAKIFDHFPVKPEGWDYVMACALWATGEDDTANQHLEKAYQRVMLVAGAMKDESFRKSWLENITINRQIINDWVNFNGL